LFFQVIYWASSLDPIMWVLEHDGDVLHGSSIYSSTCAVLIHVLGKKLWLRPGTKFLFGRTARKTTEEGRYDGRLLE
jgi:hypothetical protein